MIKGFCSSMASVLVVLAPVCASVTSLKAQAAVEYTLGTSKASAGGAALGQAMSQSLSKAAGKLSGDLNASTHENPAQVMQANRTALEKSANEDGGILHIVSDPDDAAIFVDGRLVARTPARIKVPAGNHQLMLSRPDRDQWTLQVKLAKRQTLEVTAKLVNTNPSVISLDFRDSKKQ